MNSLHKLPHHYAPYYCEENIWHLAQQRYFAKLQSYVVFISNESRSCALWWQKAARTETTPVIWDYHVVMLTKAHTWEIWDLDTTLSLPLIASEYLKRTFLDADNIAELYRPCFKLIESSYFIAKFSSDRNHMRAGNGGWTVPPPPWPAIGVSECNLMQFIDMHNNEHGQVLNLFEFNKLVQLETES